MGFGAFCSPDTRSIFWETVISYKPGASLTGSSEAGPEPAEQAARINITAAMQAGWVLRSGCTRCERPAKGETSSIVTRPASAPLAPRKPSAQSQAAPLLPRSKPEDEHCDRCQAVSRKAKPQVHFPGLARLLRTAAIVARKKTPNRHGRRRKGLCGRTQRAQYRARRCGPRKECERDDKNADRQEAVPAHLKAIGCPGGAWFRDELR